MIEQEDPDFKERVGTVLSALVKKAYEQERSSREIMIRKYKKLDLIASGSLYSVWDDSVSDFRTLDQMSPEMLDELEIDPAQYSRSINVFRAWLESIVGALCVEVPHVKFSPESYSSYEDVLTAKAYEKISDKIDVDNDAQNKLVECVWDLAKHGMFGIYSHVHEDKRYGIVKEAVYGTAEVEKLPDVCPACGYVLGEGQLEQPKEQQFNETESQEKTELTDVADETEGNTFEQGTTDNVPYPVDAPPSNEICPQCGIPLEKQKIQQVVETGSVDLPRRRVLIDVFGPLNIIVPQNSKSQKDVGFLICDREIHEAHAKALYPNIKDKISGGSSSDVAYDRWARASSEFGGDYVHYAVTHRHCWLRPWYYEMLSGADEDVYTHLKEKYPTGCRLALINEDLAEIVAEDLDECWELSFNPLNNRIYDYSVGMGAMPIQEMFSEMANLILMTIQYGIPETFADPEFFSFEKYKQVRSSAGLIFPTKMPQGQSLDSVFHSVKPAVLPKDAVEYMNRLEQLGQLVTGAFPSIYGGQQSSGSRTAKEYEKSISQALQRLSLLWKITNTTWTNAKAKAAKLYKEAMRGDEVYSKRLGADSFVDVWIRQSELSGKVGRALPELTEALPISFAAQKQTFMELIGLQNETINIALFDPNNSTYIKNLVGLKDLYIPGEEDRTKQLREIAQLVSQAPVDNVDPMTLMPVKQASVPIDAGVDTDEIHIEVCNAFLKSDVGIYLKETNLPAYENVLLHKQMHEQNLQMMQEQQMQADLQRQAMMNAVSGKDGKEGKKNSEMNLSIPGEENEKAN